MFARLKGWPQTRFWFLELVTRTVDCWRPIQKCPHCRLTRSEADGMNCCDFSRS